MLRRLGAFALPLGFACALAIAACGSNDSKESGATVAPPPIVSGAGTVATTGTTVSTTAQTTTASTTTTSTAATTTTTTSSHSSGGATTTQPSGGVPAECPNVVGGFIRNLHAGDCGVGRTVASAWFDAVHGGAAPDSPVEAAGYRCLGVLTGERADVLCDGSGGTVAFTASP